MMLEHSASKIINHEFFEKCENFSRKALSLLVSYLEKGEEIPTRFVEKNQIIEGCVQTTLVPQPYFWMFVYEHMSEIEALEEYKQCVECMQRDKEISRHIGTLVGTWSRLRRIEPGSHLLHILLKLLESYYKEKQFNEQLFQKMYCDLEEFFYNDSITIMEIVPLHNFDSNIEKIEFGNGLSIRTMTNKEKEEYLLDNAKPFSILPYPDVRYLKYVIEVRHSEKKIFGDEEKSMEHYDSTEIINKLVTTLRLFKEGIFGYNIIQGKYELDIPRMEERRRASLLYRPFIGQPYKLSQNELPALQDFWKLMSATDFSTNNLLNVALRRFNYAYERDKPEDKLVDYMIAFEALFFKKGESGELRHKLASRVARLLKDSFKDRKDVFEEMKEFYDERSSIVHGEAVTITEDVNKIEDYLRSSIKIFVDKLQTQKHEDIIEHLDLD